MSHTAVVRSALVELPASLLAHTFTFLPLCVKFTALTHLSRRFPRPCAPSFQHDHLHLSPAGLLPLLAQPHALALLAHLPCATFAFVGEQATDTDDDDDETDGAAVGPELLTRFLSSSSLLGPTAACSSLRALYLRGVPSTVLQSLASSTPSLPLLDTLAVTVGKSRLVGHFWVDNTAVMSAWLSALPSLRHLTWWTTLNVRAVWYLASLPCTSLDLRKCAPSNMLAHCEPADARYNSASVDTTSGKLRRLCLPSERKGHMSQRAVYDSLAQLLVCYARHGEQREETRASGALSSDTRAEWRLEHLEHVDYTPPGLALHALSLSSLTSLHVSTFRTLADSAAFFDTASPLNLPRLSRLSVPVTEAMSRRADWLISEACLAFFPAFAAQLQHLTLTGWSSTARACLRLFAAVLACTRLVSLQIIQEGGSSQPIALPDSIQRLPLLQRLGIHYMLGSPGNQAVQHGDVSRLLEACPALRTLSLTLPNASISLLTTVARACPEVREVSIHSDDERLFDMSDELAAAAAAAQASTDTPLAHLHTLHCDYRLMLGQSRPQPEASLLNALSSLLRHAPIRRLCLLPHVDVVHQPFYAAFPHLVRLRIHTPSLRAEQQHYCQQPDETARSAQAATNGRALRSASGGEDLGHADVCMERWMARGSGARSGEEEEEEEEDHVKSITERRMEKEWLSCPAFVEERVSGVDGRALTGREWWLRRVHAMAAAELKRRRDEQLQQQREAATADSERQRRVAHCSSQRDSQAKASGAPSAALGTRPRASSAKRKRL